MTSGPTPVRARRNLRIWATEYTMANPCRVAIVDGRLKYPAGNDKGQAGWDLAFRFKDLKDLASQLVTRQGDGATSRQDHGAR